MRLIAKACATILLAASASGAAAGVIYEAQGNLYDIETVSGLLSNLRSTIEAQAWFADESLARDLANEVGRDRKSTRLHSSHASQPRMPSSA